MPLTTYSPGDVLTASSLNANFTFAAANPPGGLTLISTTTIGTTVASVTVSSAFSATYDVYKIVISGGVSSGQCDLAMTLGATTTGYNHQWVRGAYANTPLANGASNASSFVRGGAGNIDSLQLNMDLVNPFLAKNTYFYSASIQGSNAGTNNGILTNTTSYTAFTLTPDNAATMTGGTIRVYGYKN